jgi:hypothetical protein
MTLVETIATVTPYGIDKSQEKGNCYKEEELDVTGSYFYVEFREPPAAGSDW